MSVFVTQQNADPDNDLIREGKLPYWSFAFYHSTPLLLVALEMEQLFVKQSPLDVYFEWLDSVIEKKVCNVRINPNLIWCVLNIYVVGHYKDG